jgi:hypothetical protein
MAGLEGGILHVIRKAQDLLIFGWIAGLLEAAEDRKGSDSSRGTTSFTTELGKLRSFVGFGVKDDATRGIEKKGSRHEPTPQFQVLRRLIRVIAVFIEQYLSGEPRSFLRIGHDYAISSVAHPGPREVLEVGFWIPNAFSNDKVAVSKLVPIFVVFVGTRPKLTRFEKIFSKGNTQERMASCPAKDVRVNTLLVFVVLLVYPRFKGYEALGLILVKSRIDGTGLGDKLMKLKGQNCVPRPLFHELLIDETDPMKEVSDSLLANGCGLP